MAERAHPDDPGFQSSWSFRIRRGFIPWVTYKKQAYRDAFFWRYRWVSRASRGKDVLDIPCGMGWGTSLIRGARSIVGIDLCEDAVREATRRYPHIASFQVGDMASLDFPDASFDAVSCLEGIEHIPVDIGKRFLKEAHRVLRPDGQLLLSSPYCRTGEHSGNPYHIHEYQPEEIKLQLSEEFSVSRIIERRVDVLDVLYMTCTVRK